MKRDMDLIRELLLKLEALPIRAGGIVLISPDTEEIQVAGYEQDELEYHLKLISDIGWIDTGGMRPMVGIGFRALTWQGHDFLDSIRSPEVWAKTKKGALEAGGFTVDLLKDIAKGFIKKQLEDRTGIKL